MTIGRSDCWPDGLSAVVTGPAVAIFLLAGCSDDSPARIDPMVEIVDGVEVATLPPLPGLFDPERQWHLEVVRSLRTVSTDGEPLLYDPRAAVEVGGSALFFLDPTAAEPLVLWTLGDAEPPTRFGRKGRGPGELGSGLRLGALSDGRLAVLDTSNRQLHFYSGEGDWIESRLLEVEIPGAAVQAPGADRFLLSALRLDEGSWHRDLLSVDTEADGVRPLLRLPDPTSDAEPGRIQNGRHLWAVTTSGIVTMWSSRPTLYVHEADGALARRIELPFTRRQITDEDIAEQLATHGPIANTLRTGPAALTNVLYAANDSVVGMFGSGLWRVAEDPYVEAGDRFWRLVSVRGAYLGRVVLPSDFWYLGPGEGTIWARVLDETGIPIVQELRLVPG